MLALVGNPEAQAEVERICAALTAALPGSFVIAASGSNAYLSKYSWCADTRADCPSPTALGAVLQAVEQERVDQVEYENRVYRFVNGVTRERFRAMLVFVRVQGVNERIVVVKCE